VRQPPADDRPRQPVLLSRRIESGFWASEREFARQITAVSLQSWHEFFQWWWVWPVETKHRGIAPGTTGTARPTVTGRRAWHAVSMCQWHGHGRSGPAANESALARHTTVGSFEQWHGLYNGSRFGLYTHCVVRLPTRWRQGRAGGPVAACRAGYTMPPCSATLGCHRAAGECAPPSPEVTMPPGDASSSPHKPMDISSASWLAT
jgi:hypothetical protein